MSNSVKSFLRGDTIVEVLFATAIFAFVAVSIISIMQKSVNTAQTALEMNLARNAMDTQAEAIRILVAQSKNRQTSINGSSFDKESDFIKDLNVDKNTNVVSMDDMIDGNNQCIDAPADSFVIDIRNNLEVEKSNLNRATVYPRLVYEVDDSNKISSSNNLASAEGIWIQAVKVANDVASTNQHDKFRAIDFHIRSCWKSASGGTPITLATIVRIHD